MTLISIGRAQCLLAGLSKAVLLWVSRSAAHCPFVQGHYQFLSFSPSNFSGPFLTYPPSVGRAASHNQSPFSFSSHPRGILWPCPLGPVTLKCKPGGYLCLLSAGVGQPPQGRRWVVSAGVSQPLLGIPAAWRGWVAPSAKSSTKKTLFPLGFTIGRKLAGQLFCMGLM